MKSYTEKIENHKLGKLILKRNETLISELTKNLQKKNPDELLKKIRTKAELPPHQVYNHYLFYKFGAIYKRFKNLESSLFLLKNYPENQKLKKRKFYKSDWIKYHYKNFITEIVSLEDTLLILISSIYNLGLLEKNCTFDLVSNNLRIDGHLKNKLKKLDSYIIYYKTKRNEHLHKGEDPDLEELDELEFFETFFLANLKSPKKVNYIINNYHKKALKSIDKKMNEAIRELYILTKDILDSLDTNLQKRT